MTPVHATLASSAIKYREKGMKAIALLEVQAMVAAVVGLDAMVKAAIETDSRQRLGGRLVTVVSREVSAVTAALGPGKRGGSGNVKVCR
ncbi:MAG: ethanolamine utilization protein EutM [Christensenellaceae bacterium]